MAELMARGLTEDEVVLLVMDLEGCDVGEARFIVDLELGKNVGCCVMAEEDEPDASELVEE